ncbi:MAG: hypothetical protein ACRDPE_08330 [Solirubrobacterales bacterium]
MSLKKAGLALVVVLALGVASVNSATAEKAIEAEGSWYKNGTVLASGEANALALTCTVGEHEGASRFVLESTVIGLPLKLTATGVSCPGGKIFNESGRAKATGKIKFTGVTVDEPAGCSVAGGSIESAALNSEVWMEENSAEKVFQRFVPASGTTLATIEFEGCALEGIFPLKGTLFGESVNSTGVEGTSQGFTFSNAINTTAGGSLTLGKSAATLTGRINVALTGGGAWKDTAPIMCTEVAVPGTGKFTNAACTVTGAGNFARVMRGAKALGGGVFCSMTEINGTGTFNDANCTNPGPGNFTATK